MQAAVKVFLFLSCLVVMTDDNEVYRVVGRNCVSETNLRVNVVNNLMNLQNASNCSRNGSKQAEIMIIGLHL